MATVGVLSSHTHLPAVAYAEAINQYQRRASYNQSASQPASPQTSAQSSPRFSQPDPGAGDTVGAPLPARPPRPVINSRSASPASLPRSLTNSPLPSNWCPSPSPSSQLLSSSSAPAPAPGFPSRTYQPQSMSTPGSDVKHTLPRRSSVPMLPSQTPTPTQPSPRPSRQVVARALAKLGLGMGGPGSGSGSGSNTSNSNTLSTPPRAFRAVSVPNSTSGSPVLPPRKHSYASTTAAMSMSMSPSSSLRCSTVSTAASSPSLTATQHSSAMTEHEHHSPLALSNPMYPHLSTDLEPPHIKATHHSSTSSIGSEDDPSHPPDPQYHHQLTLTPPSLALSTPQETLAQASASAPELQPKPEPSAPEPESDHNLLFPIPSELISQMHETQAQRDEMEMHIQHMMDTPYPHVFISLDNLTTLWEASQHRLDLHLINRYLHHLVRNLDSLFTSPHRRSVFQQSWHTRIICIDMYQDIDEINQRLINKTTTLTDWCVHNGYHGVWMRSGVLHLVIFRCKLGLCLEYMEMLKLVKE